MNSHQTSTGGQIRLNKYNKALKTCFFIRILGRVALKICKSGEENSHDKLYNIKMIKNKWQKSMKCEMEQHTGLHLYLCCS